jgi:hypothetical protein
MRSGRPFVAVKANGKRVPAANKLSDIFRNWFYAGWVVVENKWATIPPKTVRGDWEPVVSTEEFETGLAILQHHNEAREHRPRHFYLLQKLVYLQEYEKVRIEKKNEIG